MSVATILCFAPHPDDEILGCGGSLIKSLEAGREVYICYLSFGENGSPIYSPRELTLIRKKEAVSVSNFLGIPRKNVIFLSIPDNEISRYNLLNTKQILKLIRTVKPDLVYLPHSKEKSSDHAEASRLIMRALDMAGSNNFIKFGKYPWWVGNVLAYEVWTPLEEYQYSEDISAFIEKKIQALKIYKSQTIESGNVSDFISEKGKYLSGWRASMTLGEYREVFQVLRAANIYNT